MRQVTIHLAPGQTDRELERALLALDPRARVYRVTGRLGRTGVRVCAHLALRYLAAVDTLEQLDALVKDEAAVATTAAVPIEVSWTPELETATTTSGAVAEVQPVAVTPSVAETKKPPVKKAVAKKAAPAAKTEEV